MYAGCQIGLLAVYQEHLRLLGWNLEHVGGYVELIKMHCVHTTTAISSSTITAVSINITKANDINVELSRTVERDVGLSQNTLCACRLLIGCITNISETA